MTLTNASLCLVRINKYTLQKTLQRTTNSFQLFCSPPKKKKTCNEFVINYWSISFMKYNKIVFDVEFSLLNQLDDVSNKRVRTLRSCLSQKALQRVRHLTLLYKPPSLPPQSIRSTTSCIVLSFFIHPPNPS